jgi:hypothetical protein
MWRISVTNQNSILNEMNGNKAETFNLHLLQFSPDKLNNFYYHFYLFDELVIYQFIIMLIPISFIIFPFTHVAPIFI